MATYIAVMGMSANKASAVSIYEFSQDIIDNWHHIASTLDLPLDKTKPGMLTPVVPDRFSALDLSIYGFEIVTPDFQHEYKQLDLPRMIDRLHITATDKGIINYNVGGIQLISIQDSNGQGGGVFYMDAPMQLIEEANLKYDDENINGDKDGNGIIRYDRLDDGRYVMGVFLPYTNIH